MEATKKWLKENGYVNSPMIITLSNLEIILDNFANESLKAKLREAVANYMRSEGCTCCQSIDDHREHTKVLAELLDVPMYSDGSGYDFSQYATPRVAVGNNVDITSDGKGVNFNNTKSFE